MADGTAVAPDDQVWPPSPAQHWTSATADDEPRPETSRAQPDPVPPAELSPTEPASAIQRGTVSEAASADDLPAKGPVRDRSARLVRPDLALGLPAEEDGAQATTGAPRFRAPRFSLNGREGLSRPAVESPRRREADASPRVARNLSALAGGQLVTWTMTLMWTLVVPRALGPAGLGMVVSAQSVAGVLGIVLGFGTRNYLVREVVVDRAEGPKLVGTAIIMRLLLAPIVGVVAVLWARIVHDGPYATVVLYLITGMTILTLLAEPIQAAFQAIERMKYLAYADVINKSGQSLIGIALITIGFRAVGIAANMAMMALVVFLLYLLWIRRFFRIDVRTNVRRMTSMAKQSMAYWAFGLFGYFYLWIDTIMLSLMTRSQVVGWYGATTTLFQTLMFLPVLVSTAWLPRLVAAFTEGRHHLLGTARTPIEFVLVISVPIAAGTAMVAPELIHVVYGEAFAAAVPVMVVLAACIPPIYLNIILTQVLLAEKRQAVWTMVMAGAAVVNPLFNLALIPWTQSHYHNGAIGAAISLVLTELLMDIIAFQLVGRHVFDRSAIRRCALAILASGGMWVVFAATQPLGRMFSLVSGGATLIALAVILRIPTNQEMDLLRTGVTKLRHRAGSRSR